MFVWFTNTNVYFSYGDSQKQSIKYAFSFPNSVFFSKTWMYCSRVVLCNIKRGKSRAFPPYVQTQYDCLQPFHKCCYSQ